MNKRESLSNSVEIGNGLKYKCLKMFVSVSKYLRPNYNSIIEFGYITDQLDYAYLYVDVVQEPASNGKEHYVN